MDKFRYVMAVLLVISLPPAVLYWFVVHPFAAFWRRRGIWTTYIALFLGFFATAYGLYLVRGHLVFGDYAANPILIAVSVPLFVITVCIQWLRRKHLTFKVLVGLPEVDPSGQDSRLLTSGIYGRIRHPRYLELFLGLIAWALVINYASVYVAVALSVLAILVIIPIEERELEQRFGAAYRDYADRVPRFVPRRS